jgi:hypothetical protein
MRVRDYDPCSYVLPAMKYPFSQHLTGSEHGFTTGSIYVGEFRAIRIGVEFVNVEEIKRQHISPARINLLNLLLCIRLLCPVAVLGASVAWNISQVSFSALVWAIIMDYGH